MVVSIGCVDRIACHYAMDGCQPSEVPQSSAAWPVPLPPLLGAAFAEQTGRSERLFPMNRYSFSWLVSGSLCLSAPAILALSGHSCPQAILEGIITMSANWLDGFKGQHVTVWTSGADDGRTDTGTLVQMGDGWIQLVKDNGDMLLIPYTAVRIVKLLDLTQTLPAVESVRTPPLDTHIYEPNAQTLP
jgi:hypothetical protein